MDAIEKAIEALEMALREHNDFMRQADLPTGSKVIEEAIAALEAEKPAEDANDIVIAIRSYNTVPNGQCCGDPYKIAIESASSLIQQYAEAYHERRIKEAQDILDAEPRGMIATGTPSPFSLNAQLKRCEAYLLKHCRECEKGNALDALKIAREAMKERRSYCEQWESKYGKEWDNEDGYIQDAIDKLQKSVNLDSNNK